MRTLRAALDFLGAMNESALDKRVFAQLGVEQLPQLVASEFTTLSICHLASGRREVFGLPAGALSEQDRAAFDRHFHEHPLVRYHAYQGGRGTQRISDSLPIEQFRRSALYNDYYRRIRIDHAIALPIYVRDGVLVSFVLNRTRRNFTDRERALLDVLRPHLARVYQRLNRLGGLTAREAEVLRWVGAGKSDAQIAAILRISARTVQKHLQHSYEKLGVESRTAAAMRANGRR
ncbi:MAG TPA: LuxR C-terminal-related transcriptional regulator [Burkholderiales bacterium]|nr:LuxR C-terminal-related transcriptional regulator [Burkholderiales bacterium]